MKYKIILVASTILLIICVPLCIQVTGQNKFNALKNYYKSEIEEHLPQGSSIEQVLEFLKDKDGKFSLYSDEPYPSSDHRKYKVKNLIIFTSNERILNLRVLTLHSTLEILFLFDDNGKLKGVIYRGIDRV